MLLLYKKYTIEQYKLIQVCVTNKLPVQYIRSSRNLWLSVWGGHRRRMYTEEEAKFVAAVWETEFIKFLAALAILHQDVKKNRMKCARMI